MDVTDISPQLDQLDGDLQTLRAALKPLLGDISDVASKLPLLDKAKLYVLVSYALESILFSSLKLNEVDVTDHAVATELVRIKEYFAKIQRIETPEPERENSLDTQAAIRFLRSDLSDNKDVRKKLTIQLAVERERVATADAAKGQKRGAENSVGSTAPSQTKRSRQHKGPKDKK